MKNWLFRVVLFVILFGVTDTIFYQAGKHEAEKAAFNDTNYAFFLGELYDMKLIFPDGKAHICEAYAEVAKDVPAQDNFDPIIWEHIVDLDNFCNKEEKHFEKTNTTFGKLLPDPNVVSNN